LNIGEARELGNSEIVLLSDLRRLPEAVIRSVRIMMHGNEQSDLPFRLCDEIFHDYKAEFFKLLESCDHPDAPSGFERDANGVIHDSWRKTTPLDLAISCGRRWAILPLIEKGANAFGPRGLPHCCPMASAVMTKDLFSLALLSDPNGKSAVKYAKNVEFFET
jgi:hypothetical protein